MSTFHAVISSSRCCLQAPIFAYDKREADKHCVLYPDFTFGCGGWPLARLPSWQDFRFAAAMDGSPETPWVQRIPKLVSSLLILMLPGKKLHAGDFVRRL